MNNSCPLKVCALGFSDINYGPCFILACVGFDLDSVLYELQRVKFPAHKWRLLANSLRVASVVDDIDANHRDVAGKLQAVVRHWMDNTTQHNQWITLIEAVIMCDECGVAEQLATADGVEYTPSGEHMVCMLDVYVVILTNLHSYASVGGSLEAYGSRYFCLLLSEYISHSSR